jgi:hypothetical protein
MVNGRGQWGGPLTGRPKDMTITRLSKSRLLSLPSTVITVRGLDLHLLHLLAPPMVPLVPLWLDFLWAWPTRNYDSMTPIGLEWDWTRWWILRRGPNSEHCVTARALPALVMLLPRLPSSASLLRRRCPSLPLCRDHSLPEIALARLIFCPLPLPTSPPTPLPSPLSSLCFSFFLSKSA